MEYRKLFTGYRTREKLLEEHGFSSDDKEYTLKIPVQEGDFSLIVKVKDGAYSGCELMDNETGDEFILFTMEDATGEFVGSLRMEAERILMDLRDEIFSRHYYDDGDSDALVSEIKKVTEEEPEFLFKDSPETSIIRRQDNGKWYCVIMNLEYSRLSIEKEGKGFFILMKEKPEEVEKLLRMESYHEAFHMNKEHWFSMEITEKNLDEIVERTIRSRELVKGRK